MSAAATPVRYEIYRVEVCPQCHGTGMETLPATSIELGGKMLDFEELTIACGNCAKCDWVEKGEGVIRTLVETRDRP